MRSRTREVEILGDIIRAIIYSPLKNTVNIHILDILTKDLEDINSALKEIYSNDG